MSTTLTDREDAPDAALVVWIARVPEFREELPALESLLDPREVERAGRFRFPEDRTRFVVGRGLLRHALRRYAPQIPATLEIAYSNLGRPFIPAEHEAPRFSISHTRDLVTLAFADVAQVGVDVEFIQAPVDLLDLAERILSEDDFRTFQTFPPVERQLAFFRAWTRKEAYLKARGEGIGTGLQDVSVSFAAEAASPVNDRRDESSASWRLHMLPVPDDYMSCVACDEAARPVASFAVRMNKGELRLKPIA